MKTNNIQYKVLEAIDLEDLENQVVFHLKRGWELQGGIAEGYSESDEYLYVMYLQAVIRKQKETKGK